MTTLSLGYFRNALHAGCASAVARVLDAYGVEVEFVDADQSEMPGLLDEGAIDVLVSAWLPRDAEFKHHKMSVLGILYRPYYCWASYEKLSHAGGLSEGAVDNVVAGASDAAQMNALVAQSPGLSGVEVTICDDEALYATVKAARAVGKKSLVFLSQPHALFHDEAFQLVNDPRLPEEMEACVMISDSVVASADQDMLDELSEMTLGNKVMSALDHAIQIDGMDPEEAAEAWQRGRLVSR